MCPLVKSGEGAPRFILGKDLVDSAADEFKGHPCTLEIGIIVS